VKIELTRPHALDVPTLRARVRRRFEHYADRYTAIPLRDCVSWGDRTVRGSFRGGGGVLTFGDASLTATVELPFFARPLRDRIERLLQREFALATDATVAV
jgi:hypothetical protein